MVLVWKFMLSEAMQRNQLFFYQSLSLNLLARPLKYFLNFDLTYLPFDTRKNPYIILLQIYYPYNVMLEHRWLHFYFKVRIFV